MLALPSMWTSGFVGNPLVAMATRVAEVSIVGFDARRSNAAPPVLAPLRALESTVRRTLSALVMTTTPEIESFPARATGDLRFDPLGLSSPETFSALREAEVKHGRLAMLAAMAWPLQEILHPILVDGLYAGRVPDMLFESNGASPSLLNGGLFQPEVLPALALAVLLGAFVEETSIAARAAQGLRWNEYRNSATPGDLKFDPLNLYRPLRLGEKLQLHETELLNGRVAMLAVAAYVATESGLQTTVVRATPALFEPLILVPWFRAAMDSAFSVASMDGAIDGIAY